MLKALATVMTLGMGAAVPAMGQTIYLNDQNISVALGPSMSPEPFANRTAAASLASVIDAPSAAASEFHTQSTHVWVSGGTLELLFDFGAAYDLTTLHFWNYHTEGFDVDNIDFDFFDEGMSLVGSVVGFAPALGGSAPNDATPIFAQDHALSFPTNVRYVTAVLSGSNGQVDFTNIGFTGALTATVPEPATVALLALGLGVILSVRRLRQAV